MRNPFHNVNHTHYFTQKQSTSTIWSSFKYQPLVPQTVSNLTPAFDFNLECTQYAFHTGQSFKTQKQTYTNTLTEKKPAIDHRSLFIFAYTGCRLERIE